MKNIGCYTGSVVVAFAVIVVVLFHHSETLFPSWWGSHSLGDNFYAMDWDGGNQIVVYCPNPRGKTAISGLYLIKKRNMDCIDIKYNDTYIAMIAHDMHTGKLEYYIFDKRCIEGIARDSVTYDKLQAGLEQFPNENQYKEQCQKLKIK